MTEHIVRLPDDLMEKCKAWGKACHDHDMRYVRDPMPFSRHLLNDDALRQWLASRKEIAKTIDPVTCEIGWWGVNECDPYGIRVMLLPDGPSLERERYENSTSHNRDVFVRSPDSNGWVYAFDLSNDQHEIVYARARAMSKEPAT
jgi:hypothetical protein